MFCRGVQAVLHQAVLMRVRLTQVSPSGNLSAIGCLSGGERAFTTLVRVCAAVNIGATSLWGDIVCRGDTTHALFIRGVSVAKWEVLRVRRWASTRISVYMQTVSFGGHHLRQIAPF